MRTLPQILVLAAAVTLAAAPLDVSAQPAPSREQQTEAATRFKKGTELFKDGDYQAALIEFRRAYELAPNYNVLYNIGQVYFQLQDYPNALTSLERYLSDGGAKVSAARKADIQKDIEKLRSRIAYVELVTTVPDADITIDDVTVGKSPLAKPIMVSAGRHKITVSKVGSVPATKVIEIASSEVQKVSLDPQAAPPPAPPPAAAPPPAPPPPAPTAATPPPVAPAPPPEPPKGGCAGCTAASTRGGDALGAAVAAIAMAVGARSRRRSGALRR